MLTRLRPHWNERVVYPKEKGGRLWGIGGLDDHLHVLLILYRCALPQGFLTCLYGVNQSAISGAMSRSSAQAANSELVLRQKETPHD